MGKRKEGHSSSQTMTSSFSFATLALASAARLHCKGILAKEIKSKLSLIKLMSSRIHAASRKQILSQLIKSTSSTKLHSTSTFAKLIFWQKSKAFLIIKIAVQCTGGLSSSLLGHRMQQAVHPYCCCGA